MTVKACNTYMCNVRLCTVNVMIDDADMPVMAKSILSDCVNTSMGTSTTGSPVRAATVDEAAADDVAEVDCAIKVDTALVADANKVIWRCGSTRLDASSKALSGAKRVTKVCTALMARREEVEEFDR